MSERDRMESADIAPGSEVSVDYFNLSVPNSIEYNAEQEMLKRSEHSFANFVVTIPTLFDNEFGGGYIAKDSLEVTRNTLDNNTVDIKAGVAYIGGRRYRQLSNIIGSTVLGSPTGTSLYYIHLRYTKSTGTFDFYASTSELEDTSTVKYLTLASATYATTAWADDFTDLRASNTQLPPPITFAKGDALNYILTVQNTSSPYQGIDLLGTMKIGDVGTDRYLDIYGTTTEALTIHDIAGPYSGTIVSDAANRIKILNNLYVPTTTTLGSVVITGAGISSLSTLAFGAGGTISTASGDISFNNENLTTIGAIGCASVTATGNISALTYTGEWTGTAIADTYVANDITLTNITQITNRSHTNLTDIGSNTHSTIDTHIGTSSIHFTQGNITTVGTIGSGTWNATAITAAKGGTGQTSYSTGNLLYASGTTALSKLAAGATNAVLMGGTTPSWDSTPSVSTITATSTGSSIASSASVGGVTLNSGTINMAGALSGVTTISASSTISTSGNLTVSGGNIYGNSVLLKLGVTGETQIFITDDETDVTSSCQNNTGFSVHRITYDESISSSSAASKTNIKSLDHKDVSDLLKGIKAKTFERIYNRGDERIGLIADEMPECIKEKKDKDDPNAVSGYDFTALVAMMLTKINYLEERLEVVEMKK